MICDQRWEKCRKCVIGGGFEANQDEITRSNFLGRSRTFGLNVEVPFGAFNAQSKTPNDWIIGTKKKVCFLTGPRQFGAVITPESSAANNADLHVLNPRGMKSSRRDHGQNCAAAGRGSPYGDNERFRPATHCYRPSQKACPYANSSGGHERRCSGQ